jgi:RNA polymerase II elongation factor ELL
MLSPGQHTLTIQPDNNDLYKHCILVKLTDSSAKAIEDYLKNKANTNSKPSIVFRKEKEKEKGEVFFPTQSLNEQSALNSSSSNSTDSQFKKFNFSISSTKESNKIDSSASCECICYSNQKLKTIGTLDQKITIQGNEEVFLATKERTLTIAEEQKNNSTLEIKPSGAIVKRETTSSNVNNSSIQRSKAPSSKIASPSTSLITTAESKPRIDRPLRERIIHLLALKPYMKAELLLKLNKDNNLTYEKDKEILESTISSCATLNPKTSQYDILNDIMLNEVKVDEWPYYNDAQRLIVKKNISKVKQLLNNNNTNNNNNWANTSLKLNHSTLTNNNTNNQKQTTQASAFVSVEQKMQVSPSSSNQQQQQQQQQRQTLPDPILQKKFKPTSSCTVTQNPKQSEFFSLSPNSDDLLSDTEPPSSTTIQPKREKENFFQLQKSTTTTTNEFTKQYKPIDTKQQYEAYLSDFEQSYDEYLELHKFIEPITKLF